jgi:hypothetical protein
MTERPTIVCKCGCICVKLISKNVLFGGVDGTASMYNFVDYNTTGRPVVINSKTQWRNHLKAHGLNDDVKNDPYTKAEIEAKVRQRGADKLQGKRKIREAVIEAYKQRRTPQAKQRARQALKKS